MSKVLNFLPLQIFLFNLPQFHLCLKVKTRPVPEDKSSPNSAKLKENEKEDCHQQQLIEEGTELGVVDDCGGRNHHQSLSDCLLPSSSSAHSSSPQVNFWVFVNSEFKKDKKNEP